MSDPEPPPSAKPRAFLDANILYSAAIGGRVKRLWDLPDIALVTSEYAAKEAHDNLDKETDPAASRAALADLLARIEVRPHNPDATLFISWPLTDPRDIPIVAGAIESGRLYLLTGDQRCFGQFFGGPALDGLRVLKPSEFLRLYDAGET